MNLVQRAWRKQRATNRARNIRRYRKGHPKLGCYKCWCDCYEIEGDRCPECNELIERDVPWWRDGKWDLRAILVMQCGGILIFGAAGYVWKELQNNVGLDVVAAALAAGFIGHFSLCGFPLLAIKRTRSEQASFRRMMSSLVFSAIGITLIIQVIESQTN